MLDVLITFTKRVLVLSGGKNGYGCPCLTYNFSTSFPEVVFFLSVLYKLL